MKDLPRAGRPTITTQIRESFILEIVVTGMFVMLFIYWGRIYNYSANIFTSLLTPCFTLGFQEMQKILPRYLLIQVIVQ